MPNMDKSSGQGGGSAGLPRWAVNAITVFVLCLGVLFVAGQLGRMAGTAAGAEALRKAHEARAANARPRAEADVAVAPSPTTTKVQQLTAPDSGKSGPDATSSEKRYSNFATLPLPKGVTVELPKNWVALTDNQRVTLDSLIEAKQDLAGITRPESDLPFAANYMDDSRNVAAMFNVRFYPKGEWTQDFVRGLTHEEIGELDNGTRAETEASMKTTGIQLLEWKGTARREINGLSALVVEYRRKGARPGTTFCVRLVRVINAGRSFTVTVSYREDSEQLLRPICDRIIESIRQ